MGRRKRVCGQSLSAHTSPNSELSARCAVVSSRYSRSRVVTLKWMGSKERPSW